MLSDAGVPGLTPEDQAQRAEQNPATSAISEMAGFGAGAALGTGEAAVLGKIGEAAAATASSLGKATIASRLAIHGIRAGAEIAALQAGNEVSKSINQDPNQTLGSAAVNIGLAGLIGGVGGVALGGISDLWSKGLSKADELVNDVKARVAYRQSLEAGEIASPTVTEGFDPFTKEATQVTKTLPNVTREQVYDPFHKTSVTKGSWRDNCLTWRRDNWNQVRRLRIRQGARRS